MGRSMVVCAAVVALSTAAHAAGTGVKVGFQIEQGLTNLTKTVGEELELTTLQIVTTLRF